MNLLLYFTFYTLFLTQIYDEISEDLDYIAWIIMTIVMIIL